MSFISNLLAPLEGKGPDYSEMDLPDLGMESLIQLVGMCRGEDGVRIKDMEPGKKRNEVVKDGCVAVMKRSVELCEAAYAVGGEFREKMADIALDQVAAASDLCVAIQAGVWDGENGEHASLFKLPKNKLQGGEMLSLLHSLVRDTFAHLFDIKDPVDLHRLVYHACLLMAMVEAKVVARAHTKNIDTANILENRAVIDLSEASVANSDIDLPPEIPMCDYFKDKNFWNTKIEGNTYLNELMDALGKETKAVDKMSKDVKEWGL